MLIYILMCSHSHTYIQVEYDLILGVEIGW